jgi:enoyl-CoA hydratase
MGMTLALHCDLRIAARNTVIGYPEVRHGMISAVSAMRLAEVIPQAYAMEMLLMARNIKAEEAKEFGLLNAVVDDAHKTATEWGEQIASFPAVGVQTTKRLAMFARRSSYSAACREFEAARNFVEAHEDYKQAAAAHQTTRTGRHI